MSETPYKIIKFELGGFNGSNSYLLLNEANNDGFIFDPGFDDPNLYKYIEDNNINLKKILLMKLLMIFLLKLK